MGDSMSVKELVFKYTTDGAKAAQRADQKVRDSVRETGAVAEQEAGTVERWMTANKAAIQGLAAASLAAVGAIVSASPTMRAELSGVRTAFSLFADTVVRDVLPSTGSLAQGALNLAKAYRNIPDPIRTVISQIITFTALISGAALALGTLHSAVQGTFIATLGAKAVAAIKTASSAIGSFIAGSTAAAVALGAFIGVLGVGILEITGVLDAVRNLGQTIGNSLPGWVRNGMLAVTSLFIGPLAVIGAAIVGFVEGFLAGGLSEGIDRMVQRTKEMLGIFAQAWIDLINGAVEWGSNLINNVIQGISNRFDGLRNWAGNLTSTITDELAEMVNGASQFGRDLVNGIIDGLQSRLQALRNAAENLAGEIRDRLPSSPAKKGPLSDLDKVGPGAAETVASGLENSTDRVAQSADRFAGSMGGMTQGTGQGGGQTQVVIEKGAIVVQGTGNSRRDGEKVGQEASEYIGRSLGSRGA